MHHLRRKLSRRALLRGAGAALGLPLLDAMFQAGCSDPTPTETRRVVERGTGWPSVRPTRLVYIVVPNGFVGEQWTPPDEGPAYTLTPHLQNLAAHRADFTVLSGLSNLVIDALGAYHTRALATLLTCTAVDRQRVSGGVSIDQVAASYLGRATALPSLELGTTPPHAVALSCDGAWGCLWADNIAWAGPQRPMPKDADPRSVFNRLFGGALGVHEAGAAWQLRQTRRQSVIDFALSDANRLRTSLGANDRVRLDQYLSHVREVEIAIGRQQQLPLTDVMAPTDSVDLTARFETMLDLTALALQTDRTQVVSLAHGFSFFNYTYPTLLGAANQDGHHKLSHYSGDPGSRDLHATVCNWELAAFGRFLARMKSIDDGGRDAARQLAGGVHERAARRQSAHLGRPPRAGRGSRRGPRAHGVSQAL